MKKQNRKIRKCPKTRKTMFNQQRQAQFAMMRVISHDPNADMFDLHTYLCDHCKKWHFGHRKWYKPVEVKVADTMSVGVS